MMINGIQPYFQLFFKLRQCKEQNPAMNNKFLQWSIPHYFVSNYLEGEFHSQCPQKQEIKQATILIRHFQDYLIQWKSFGGKWINQFILEPQFMENLRKKQSSSPKISNFSRFLAFFDLKYQHLLIIQFIAKYFSIRNHQASSSDKNSWLKEMTHLYFNYQIEISFDEVQDVGKPCLMTSFVKSIVKDAFRRNHFQYSLSLLSELANACGFEDLYYQAISQNGFSLENNKQKNTHLSSKHNIKVQSVSSSDQLMAIQTRPIGNIQMSTHFKLQIFQNNRLFRYDTNQTNETKGTQRIDKKKLQDQSNGTKNAVEKIWKSKKRTQNITKTTRQPNFKGLFTKRMKQIGLEAAEKDLKQKQVSINYRIQQKTKKFVKIEQEALDHMDFLCDKSF